VCHFVTPKGKAGFAVKNIQNLWLGFLILAFLGCVCPVVQAMDEAQVEQSFAQFQKEWVKKLNTEGKYGEKTMKVEKSPYNDSFTAKYNEIREAPGSKIKSTGQAATPYVGTMHYQIFGCTATGDTAEEAKRGPFNCVLQGDTNEIFRFNGTKWLY
jgi:hypothetical protein